LRLKLKEIAPFGTRIDEIRVPAELLRRFPTGVDWLDRGLGGEGFTPSTVTMFCGESGAGKTTALLTVANGLARAGHLVVYNTAEESLFQVKRTVDRLRLGGFHVGSETNVDQLLRKTDELRRKSPGRQCFLFVDSLQCMDDGYFETGRITSATAERSMEKIAGWAKETFSCPIVIGHVTKGGQFRGSNTLRHMVDCMMHLGIERKDEERMNLRKFEVTKNRFGGCGCLSWLRMTDRGLRTEAVEDAE